MTEDSNERLEVLQRIQLLVGEILGVPDLVLNEATTAGDVPGWDSLTHVQIIIAIEQEFGIRLSTTEVAQLENSGSLVDAVLKHASGMSAQ